jgi:hypothetical protein
MDGGSISVGSSVGSLSGGKIERTYVRCYEICWNPA